MFHHTEWAISSFQASRISRDHCGPIRCLVFALCISVSFFWPACLRSTRHLLLRIKLFVCDCDVFQRLAKDSPYLFTILHCIFSSFASWSILDDVFVVICGFRLQFFSSGHVPRSVVACKSGMCV